MPQDNKAKKGKSESRLAADIWNYGICLIEQIVEMSWAPFFQQMLFIKKDVSAGKKLSWRFDYIIIILRRTHDGSLKIGLLAVCKKLSKGHVLSMPNCSMNASSNRPFKRPRLNP